MQSSDSDVRERTDEALRRSEARLSEAQRIAHIGNWDWNIQANDLHWSDEIYRIFGLAPRQSGATYEAFLGSVHPDDRQFVRQSVDDALYRGKPYSIDHRVIRPDGSQRIVHESAEVTFDEAGKPLRMAGTVQDVTERKQAELAMKASEATLAAIFQNAPVAMFLLDHDRRVHQMNRAAEEVLGGSTAETKARAFGNAIHCVHALDDPKGCGCGPSCGQCPVRRIVSDTFDTAEAHRSVEVSLTLEDASERDHTYLCLSTALIERPEDHQVLVCIENITDRKRAELELQSAFSEIARLKDRLQQENLCLREEIQLRYEHEEIVGHSDAIKGVMAQVEQVAATPAAVLLLGETGTGKELFARAIHRLSPRKDAAMVAVNCAALPATLVESELFGREAGAYTGALSKQIGRFEMADGSTLFLDEIGELSTELQVKLLRVLQDGQFERLGSSQTISVDVRIIAATNRDLAQAVRDGDFREDLYHRLNVFPIRIPPLSQRPDDIPLLVWAFVKEFAVKMGKAVDTIPRRTMEALQRYSWPGNVRELRNVVERAMILSKGPTLHAEVPAVSGSSSPQPMTLADVERAHILDVLNKTGWRVRGKNATAEILGLKPTTLESRMAKLGIRRGRRTPDMS